MGARQVDNVWIPWPLLTRAQIEESPSFKLGMSFKNERKLREAACKIIGEAGKTLEQGIVSIATAQMYLMRFFASKSYQQNDNFIVAVAALFVASKTENKPRPLHQIAHACWKHWVMLWVKEQKKKQKDKPASYWDQLAAQEYNCYRDATWYKRFAEAITTAERVLLYTTGFQFNVNTGFYALLGCKAHLLRHCDTAVVSFFEGLNLQIVWNFVIECYRSTRLCLQFDPRTIGIACYEMTCAQLNRQIPLVDGDLWWRYVARVEGWPETVGNIEDVKAVQTELMKVFQPNQPREKALAQAARPNSGSLRWPAEWASQPGTPGLQNGSQTPGASPPPPLPQAVPSTMENGLEAQLAGPSEAQYGNGKSHSHPSNYPIATIPAPQPPELPLANTHIKSEKPPTAQVKQKAGAEGVHFSPSDEFNVSPRKQANTSMAAPDLLDPLDPLENGELVLPVSGQRSQDGEELRRSRLERAKALGNFKRKADSTIAPGPAAKLRHTSPDDNFGIDFEP